MGNLNKLKVFFKWTRYKELLLLTSPGLMGLTLGKYSIFLAIKHGKSGEILLFFIALCFGGAHVFLFNLWSGIKLNIIDASSIDYPLKYDEINTNTILISSILLLGASFVINYFLSIKIFIISLIIATLWILYAFPKFLFLKSSYTGALFVHYINGNLHFLIGYILFNKISAQAILLSQFFALIFIAGYFHHILKDRETDKLMGIKNLANKYSPSFIFFIGNLIFFISYLYLGVLVILKLLPYLFFIYNTLVIILLYITYNKIRRTDLSKSIILKYRTYYRFLYSIYGILMVLTILQSEWNKLIN